MTKKDYIIIASVLQGHYERMITVQTAKMFEAIVDSLSVQFANENPRFDERKFSKAIFPKGLLR